MFVIQKIISELNKFGLEQSDPGEFMKQAYMNGKIDLSKSEAINTLILSDNKALSINSIQNLNGKQSLFIEKSINKLGEIFSNIQVSIDYPENTDLPEYNLNNIKEDLIHYVDEIKVIINDSSRLIKYSKGIVVSLVGIPNAGKSSLLNSLTKEDRAIVSNIEGTTRDVVESTIYLDGIKITLQDTAGIRNETNDLIEKEGISRSLNSIKNSDIVLLLLDGTKDLNNQRIIFKDIIEKNKSKLIQVKTKSDISSTDLNFVNISSLNNDIEHLINAINIFVKENIFDIDKNNNSLLITQNQVDQFTKISDSLNSAINFIEYGETPDVVLFEIEIAMKHLGKIIGKEIDQDYLSNLFSSFCIGK